MPIINHLPKNLITIVNPPLTIISLQSRTLCQLSAPTHDHIAQLILDNKSPSQAFQTFKWASKLPNFTHNQSTYRAMIYKLCSFRRFDDAHQLLDEMPSSIGSPPDEDIFETLVPNFTHNQSTYRAMIYKLCSFRRFDDAHQLLDEMPSSIGSPPDEDIFVTLVRGLGRAKRVREVIRVPDLARKFGLVPSLKVYNSILDVLVKEDISIARGFYREKMMESGFEGDEYTYGILMKGLCVTNRIRDGFKLLKVMKTRGLSPNTVIYNTLLHSLCRNGKVGRARSLMSEMVKPDDVTYSLMISAYCNEGYVVQAQVLLEKSLASGCIPSVVATTKVIDLLCNIGRVNDAAEVLERVERHGGVVDVVAYNTLIKGFCSSGKAKVGLHFKKHMENKGYLPNIKTYNTLIAGFCDMNLLDVALDLFSELKRAAIDCNFVTYDTLIQGFCSKGRVDDAFPILELMEESKGGSGGRISPYNNIIFGLYRENRLSEALGFLNQMSKMFPRTVDRTLIIIGLCEDGNLKSAKEVYAKMLTEGGTPSVLVSNSLIQCFSKHSQFREAFQLMNEMVDCGFPPVSSTCNAVISGFCEQDKIASALHLIEEMEERGCSLDVGSYRPLIVALCNRGDLEEALKMFQQMLHKGIKPDYSEFNGILPEPRD